MWTGYQLGCGGRVGVEIFFPSLVLLDTVLASFVGPGGCLTVVESFIDGLLSVEDVAAAFLRIPLFAVRLVGVRTWIWVRSLR